MPMKTKLNHQLVAAVALLSTCILQPATLLAQGSLTPPGPPAPTMKTLAQIEARTPISTAPSPWNFHARFAKSRPRPSSSLLSPASDPSQSAPPCNQFLQKNLKSSKSPALYAQSRNAYLQH
jgi:hypothetical protein